MCETTHQLIVRFNKHCARAPILPFGPVRTYHVAAARGLHKLLTQLALDGDEDAANAALGAPHFITFSDAQVRTL
jgi:hypothetical protein